jgi:hypothetical protein
MIPGEPVRPEDIPQEMVDQVMGETVENAY